MVCGPFPSPLPLCVRAARKNGPSPPDDVAGQEVGGSPFAAISVFSISEYLPRVCPEEASSVDAQECRPFVWTARSFQSTPETEGAGMLSGDTVRGGGPLGAGKEFPRRDGQHQAGQRPEVGRGESRSASLEPWPGTFWAEGVKQTPQTCGGGEDGGPGPPLLWSHCLESHSSRENGDRCEISLEVKTFELIQAECSPRPPGGLGLHVPPSGSLLAWPSGSWQFRGPRVSSSFAPAGRRGLPRAWVRGLCCVLFSRTEQGQADFVSASSRDSCPQPALSKCL